MSTLYLLQYNNYQNRRLMLESSLSAYKSHPYRQFNNINFDKADGVYTSQTINFSAAQTQIDADYLIVTAGEDSQTIVSRWFIIEATFSRGNQIILSLRRDLLVDFLPAVKEMPFFWEKGVVASSDSAVFNGEEMTFNQLRDSTVLLKPASEIYNYGYIVGYIDKSFSSAKVFSLRQDVRTIPSLESLPFWEAYSSGKAILSARYQTEFKVRATEGIKGQIGDLYQVTKNYNGSITGGTSSSIGRGYSAIGSTDYMDSPVVQTFLLQFENEINTAVENQIDVTSNFIYRGQYEDYNNAVVFTENTRKYYLITFTNQSAWTTKSKENIASDINVPICTYWDIFRTPGYWSNPGQSGYYPIHSIKIRYHAVNVTITEQAYETFTIPQYSSRDHTSAPYDIFVCPYTSSNLLTVSRIASAFYGSGALLDIQRVPYVPDDYASGNTWTVGTTVLYWLKTDSFSKQLSMLSVDVTYTAPSSAVDLKVDALTKFWRIKSPNHADAWDFVPALNGSFTKWYVQCTLKPFKPFIRVFPELSGLYGDSGYDNRGLIFGGSMSLPIASDAWETFAINNSAYADSFEREIDNLSFTQKKAREAFLQPAIESLASSVIQGYKSGGWKQALLNGSVEGFRTQLNYNRMKELQNEALDFKKDQFGYQLRNIMAQPRTLAQSSSFDANYAGYPIIEKYIATPEEVSALKNKIKYNGMSIGRVVDKFKTALNNANTYSSISKYCKGKIIRIDSHEDAHLLAELANEIYTGFYYEGGAIS